MMADRHENGFVAPAIPYFSGLSADKAWSDAARAVLAQPDHTQASRSGDTAEILHATIRITDPRQRWVSSRLPGINPAFAIAEAFWILCGRDDADFVNFWNPALPRYAGDGDSYPGAYGKRLRQTFGFDQIQRAICALSGAPSSRQVVLQIWDPRIDFPNIDGSPASPDVPCNICSILKIRNNRLEWTQIMRSNDMFRGTPYNIVQFTLVQEYIAGCLGVGLGEFVLIADSLHAYRGDIGKFSVSATKPLLTHCSIALRQDLATAALERCIDVLDDLADPELSTNRLRDILGGRDLPQGHADLIRIAAADSARRRGWRELSDEAAGACSDAGLRAIWFRWAADRAVSPSGGSRDRSITRRQAAQETVG